MEIRQIRTANGEKLNIYELQQLAREIEKTLLDIGIRAEVIIESPTRIRVSNVRLNTKVWGSTVSGYTGRASNILGYYHWALVNYVLNLIFDKYSLSAKITSLKGLFVIRDGTEKFTLKEWEDRKWDNVGSLWYPVYRIEHWRPKDEEKFQEAFRRAIKLLLERYGDNQNAREYITQLAICVLPDPVYSWL